MWLNPVQPMGSTSSRLLRRRLARTRTAPLYPGHCRQWDISHEQLAWTFILAIHARWYTFLPPQWYTIPPQLTVWREQNDLLRSVPGVGLQLSVALL